MTEKKAMDTLYYSDWGMMRARISDSAITHSRVLQMKDILLYLVSCNVRLR